MKRFVLHFLYLASISTIAVLWLNVTLRKQVQIGLLVHAILGENDVFIAGIAVVDITVAISRRSRAGSINIQDATMVYHQLRNDIESEYQVIEITDRITNSGMRLAEKYCLRGQDAVQLAAAEFINTLCIANSLPQLTFVSADKELNIAAVSAGLLVENPHDHSSS